MFGNKKPIIAMLYLPPSLGHQNFYGLERSLQEINEDLSIILEAGFDACLLENEKDHPYLIEASHENIASLSVFTREVVRNSSIPVGFNYLLNDPKTSLTIAHAAGAQFIRSDYFVDEMKRDSDARIMKTDAASIISHKQHIGGDHLKIYADVQVKHAQLIKPRPIEESIKETIDHGADGIIISGQWTGKAPDISQLTAIRNLNLNKPTIIGSGFNHDNANELLKLCDGVIVGTAILKDGRVDRDQALSLLDIIL